MKICLLILDGWGHNQKPVKKDAINDAKCAMMRKLSKIYKSYLIHASGEYVGLNAFEMGNSEVGHLTIGSGRVIKQNVRRITNSFHDKSIHQHLKKLLYLKRKVIHLIGLVSDGGIHSHISHLTGLINVLHEHFESVYIHCISDGRDTAPKVFCNFYNEIRTVCNKYKNCHIVSVSGRFYAMDRDNNMQRTDLYFKTITSEYNICENILEYINQQYGDGCSDENIKPVLVSKLGIINSSDLVLLFNFRADRMKQITKKFIENGNTIFTMTEYDKLFETEVLFKSEAVNNTLPEILDKNDIEQVHIAETEKYAHVTYFFNGGNDKKYLKEERIIIDSKKTECYSSTPEMSSYEIADAIIKSISLNRQFIVANFASPDMVGHTGNYEATLKAVGFIDQQIERIYAKCMENEYVLIITADHGNAEVMENPETNEISKKHTNNKVPLIICKDKIQEKSGDWGYSDSKYSLADVAPTILALFNISKPSEMTGRNIINQ